MGYGIANEYLAYVIAEIARNEARKFISGEGVYIINNINNSASVPDSNNINNKNVQIIANVLNTLESYNYKLELLKQDPSDPDKLTSVVITFDENVKEIIELIRTDEKLNSVIISVYIKDDTIKDAENPFNMPTTVFIKYVFNKYKYAYYNNIFLDENSTPEQKEEAQQKMNEAHLENLNLRNLYNIPTDSYNYNDLAIFLPNPLGMMEDDFVKYVLNKKIYMLMQSGYNIPQEIVDTAINENVYLRESYLIPEDVYSYNDLKNYLPNPLGMTKEDFMEYYKIKTNNQEILEQIQKLQNEGADESEIIALKQQIYESEQPLRDKYYIIVEVDEKYNVTSDEDMSYEELKTFVETNKLEEDERLLFKIEVSLNYSRGKLDSVESKLIV